ncbi:MAG: hypothetical protein J4451_01160 [DPANN group archaeon]|nr:hypothetical protein [DPANN group archaeon]
MVKRKTRSKGEANERKTFVVVTIISIVSIVGLLGLFRSGSPALTGSTTATQVLSGISSDYFMTSLLVLVGIGLAGLYMQKEKLF